uniref:Uncharacterized protein n=1 Tax=Arundo donax TaxID=35708 RepID=A0A0A9EBX6_ARUDO
MATAQKKPSFNLFIYTVTHHHTKRTQPHEAPRFATRFLGR